MKGDVRNDAIGLVVSCGFGFGVLYVMTIYELNYISSSNLVYYSATPINYISHSQTLVHLPHISIHSNRLKKVAMIPRLERYEAIMRSYSGYRPPSWAECLIKLIYYYGTKIRYIWIAVLGDK